jgi:hypothetical protein
MSASSVNWPRQTFASGHRVASSWPPQFQQMMALSEEQRRVLAQNHGQLQWRAANLQKITPPHQSMLQSFPQFQVPVNAVSPLPAHQQQPYVLVGYNQLPQDRPSNVRHYFESQRWNYVRFHGLFQDAS